MLKLNLGCASQVIDGWVNVDYALGARLAKVPFFKSLNKRLKLFQMDWDKRVFLHDLTTPFPWKDSEVDVIYTSHTLEHLSKQDGSRFLNSCHRVLKKGGVLRVVVPDLQPIIDDYNNGEIEAEDLVEKLGVELPPARGIRGYVARATSFPHQCMYTTERLLAILDSIGFNAEQRGCFDSSIADIKEIEIEGRTQKAVVVEAVKT